jgi:protein-S-isoprenylcysteine O-methyltransferase Ste14
MLQARIPPPVYGIGIAALMWWLDRHLPILRLIPAPLTHMGWLVVTVGMVLDAYSVIGFLRARTTVNPMRITATSELVISGLYRWSRNPMYFGLIVVLAGWGITLGSLTPFIAIFLFQRLLVLMQIAPEEAALEEKFGDKYRAYKQRVHRWAGRNSSA